MVGMLESLYREELARHSARFSNPFSVIPDRSVLDPEKLEPSTSEQQAA